MLSIFAGIGGFDLAFHEAGFRTLQFVEWEPIKQCVLREWFPGIPIHGDIDTFDCGEFLATHGRPDVIAGGVPCQAISLLGKRLGTADPRWKWPQTIRVVGELRPRFCVFENPPAILTAGDGEAFNGVVSAMAALGYDCMWDVIPAAAFGAGHWRERLCIIFADANYIKDWKRPDCFGADRPAPAGEQIGAGSGAPLSSDVAGERQRIASDEANAFAGIRDAWAVTSSEGHQRALSPIPDNAVSQGHTGDDVGSGGRSDSGRSIATPRLPDMRGRVTGPDWWHEAVTGIPVLVSGLPNKLVEAASLCIGDSVVPQAWIPIAHAIYETIQTQTRERSPFLTT